MTDNETLVAIKEMQGRLESSGLSYISVKVDDEGVLSSIRRVFGDSTNIITFDMYVSCLRHLNRLGLEEGRRNGG